MISVPVPVLVLNLIPNLIGSGLDLGLGPSPGIETDTRFHMVLVLISVLVPVLVLNPIPDFNWS